VCEETLTAAFKSVGKVLAAAISCMRGIALAAPLFVSRGESIAGFLPKNPLCCLKNEALAEATRYRSEVPETERGKMKATIGAGIFLALAALMPAAPVAAQDPIGGAIVGGAMGGIIGGALGRGPGAVAGAVIGATAGAAIAAEAQRRNNGYYWWHGGCYYRYPDGSWLQVAPGYC
jgi:hypothetical protein